MQIIENLDSPFVAIKIVTRQHVFFKHRWVKEFICIEFHISCDKSFNFTLHLNIDMNDSIAFNNFGIFLNVCVGIDEFWSSKNFDDEAVSRLFGLFN